MTRGAGTALLCGLILLLSAVAAQADKRVALVVGNSAYQHAPALLNPARDAQAMGEDVSKGRLETALPMGTQHAHIGGFAGRGYNPDGSRRGYGPSQ
jgi:hypothetical protein